MLRKSIAILMMSIFVVGLSAEMGLVAGPGQNKEKVCHIPPGNPSNKHTIEVGSPAVNAHLNHGDYEGECNDGWLDPCSEYDNVEECMNEGIYL